MSGFDLATLRTDKVKEVDGVWMDYVGESKMLIARFNNPAMEKWILRKTMAATRRIADVESRLDLAREAVAKFVLLDWKLLFLDDEAIPYSKEKAYEVLTDYPDFHETIVAMSMEREAFRADNLDDAKGNSKASSSGKPSGDATKKA